MGSYVLPEEMSKFPYDGEREMAEQEDCVDLAGVEMLCVRALVLHAVSFVMGPL